VVCNGLRALAVLASNDDNAKKEILRLSAPGVVRLAGDCMERHLESAAVQQAGALFFARLVQGHLAAKTAVLNEGGVDQVRARRAVPQRPLPLPPPLATPGDRVYEFVCSGAWCLAPTAGSSADFRRDEPAPGVAAGPPPSPSDSRPHAARRRSAHVGTSPSPPATVLIDRGYCMHPSQKRFSRRASRTWPWQSSRTT